MVGSRPPRGPGSTTPSGATQRSGQHTPAPPSDGGSDTSSSPSSGSKGPIPPTWGGSHHPPANSGSSTPPASDSGSSAPSSSSSDSKGGLAGLLSFLNPSSAGKTQPLNLGSSHGVSEPLYICHSFS